MKLIKKTKNYIEIKTGINNFTYDIHLDSIKTHKQQVQWIQHLMSKNWFTNEMVDEFLKVIETIK